VTENNGTYALAVFNGLHRARFLADSVAGRYRTLLGDTVNNDPRFGRVLAYSAFSWMLLGENICETRINAEGNRLQPTELFAAALPKFDEAIAAATAARAAAANITNVTTRARTIALQDSILNLARVGAARAALNMNDKAKAITYAQAVAPAYVSRANPGFRYDLYYREGNSAAETRRHGSPYWEFISAGGSWVSLNGTGFENLNDPRVPHGAAGQVSVTGGGQWFVPNSSASFGTNNNTVAGALYTRASSLRIASAIEARYILAEAQGPTTENVNFLNEQRAVGGMPALVNPDANTFQAALRVQRSREFFIDGHRLGDLRRYERQYQVDMWPRGSMYGGAITYGDQKCWITPVSEQF
jgi:hypothetical protein